jgi:iron complex transport system ATP-binding protein
MEKQAMPKCCNTPIQSENPGQSFNSSGNQVVVRLTDVTLRRERPILEEINWTVERGQHWVVLGRNGAGKTLLLRIVAGYLWPSRGEVEVLSERFGQVDLRKLRQGLGWVSSALAERIPGRDTAREVVLSGAFATFGLYQPVSDDLRNKADRFLAEMGLEALAERKFETLSAGERQRVLLARSRLPDPKLLILDEPCAGLDLAAREKLLALISRMAADPTGPTLIMVTHRVSDIVPGFTHGLLLHRGRITASGRLKAVLTDDLLSRTLEVPLHVRPGKGRWIAEII